jgi:hypothetical protein
MIIIVLLSGIFFNAKFCGVWTDFYCDHSIYSASSVGKNRSLAKQLVASLTKRDFLYNYQVINIMAVTITVTFPYSYIDIVVS